MARRVRDYSQDIRRGCLLLQRFREVSGALSKVVKQPRVLDGDDSLAGEVLEQGDLLIGKWTNFLAKDGYGADQLCVLEHRRSEIGTRAAKVNELHEVDVTLPVRRVFGAIGNVQHLFRRGEACKNAAGTYLGSATP